MATQRFLQLPQAITMDILSRLSVNTLFNCRCVCKAWLSIISDPQFTHLHASRSPFGILIETFPPPLLTKPMELYFTLLEVEACAAPSSDLQLEEITFSPGNTLPPVDAAMPEFRLINSCNGLLCFGANEGFPLYVCNPVLGEYITIPTANRNDKWLIVGLGFSIRTNVYKVFQLNNPDTEAEIYTIGAGGAWRSIGPPPPGDFNNLSFNNFLHGAVHWIPYGGRSTSSKVIQSFDFEREQFQPLSLPSLLAQNEFLYSLTLEVIEGCLHLCVLEDDASKLDMWVMKEYGVQESWTKILAFENLFGLWTERICDRYNPIMFLSNGEILMFHNFERVVCYNQEQKSFRKIKIPSTKKWSFQPIAYSPSFLSLYDVAKGEDVKRNAKIVSQRYLQLPQAIVMDILSRLSVKTLFNCRCVCKAWLSMISDPQFTHLHASRSPFGILIETFPPPPLTKTMELYFTHLEVEACAAPGSDLQLEEIMFSPGNTLPPVDAAMPEFRLINSCNGLLCFGANEGFPLYVCNPVLGEYITIPPANRNDKWLIVGLGFSIRTNVYKVFQLNNPDTEAEIYTIGAGGAWRSIGPPPPGDFNNLSFNNFLHGAVHWIPYGGRSTSSKVIQSFDFEREQFRPLSLPSLLAQNEFLYSLTLEVIGGCLHLCVLEDDASKLDMWVMKEYGVQESWTKILTFENLFGLWTERICDRYNPIMFLSNGEILMFYNFERVVCYNQEQKSFRKIKIPSTKKWSFQPIAYSPSFLSLYDIAKAEDVKRHVKRLAAVRDITSCLFDESSYDCTAFEEALPKAKNSSLDLNRRREASFCYLGLAIRGNSASVDENAFDGLSRTK
ncbi:unnamed protein product [Prunus armeniaca]